MGMRLPVYNALAKKSVQLSLPWHSSTIPIADSNHNIILGKDQHPAKPCGPREFFMGCGYYTHNTEGYVPRPESLVIPSRPPPAERSAEEKPFFHVPRNPDDRRVQVDITSGSVSLTASHLFEQEALSQKNAAVASSALSMAEYIHNYPGMPEVAKAVMHHLKLDLVACCNFS